MNKKNLFLLLLLTACTASEKANEQSAVIDKNKLPGIWTDGSGPNSTIRIDDDSIYNFDLSEYSTYELKGDSVFIKEDGEVFKGKIRMPHPDTLVYSDADVTRMYWRTDVHPDSVKSGE